MCGLCFNRVKKCKIQKKIESRLNLLQYRFQGGMDREDFSSELVIHQDIYLLGLPTNHQHLSYHFQESFKASIYFKMGNYFAAANDAFESTQTYINSCDSLVYQEQKKKKNVFGFMLICKDQIETYSSVPTYGIVLNDFNITTFSNKLGMKCNMFRKIVQFYLSNIDNFESEGFIQSCDLREYQKRCRNLLIIFGNKMVKFKENALLSESISTESLKQNKDLIQTSFDQIYENTEAFLTEYFQKLNCSIQESYNPCGYVINPIKQFV